MPKPNKDLLFHFHAEALFGAVQALYYRPVVPLFEKLILSLLIQAAFLPFAGL